MEENLLNTSVELNTSVDSWNGDEDVNKIIDLRNTQDTKLNVAGAQGDKCQLTSDSKTYFAKEYKTSEQLLETASCSAMLSCFSHTPYPVGIKKSIIRISLFLDMMKKTIQNKKQINKYTNILKILIIVKTMI